MQEENLWIKLQNATKPVVLYGMGNGADKILALCEKYGVKVSGVFASDGFARHNEYHGFTVLSYSEMKQKFGEMIVLVSFGTQRPEVISLIAQVASEQELYCPDTPVIGEGEFECFYSDHREEFDCMRERLADEQSKLVWDSMIAYRLSGKIEYLKQAETPVEESYVNILKLTDHEDYLDLGAYTGDTVKEFLNYVNSYSSITAVEPDRKTFQKLTQNAPFARCIQAAVSSHDGEVLFQAAAGRQSSIGKNGTPIPAISIDGLHSSFSYVKMDVEGAECAAIEGGQETIALCKPKMLIAAYHRTEDYLEIPRKVLNINPDYRVYMRHHPYIPAWDTNFYFI